jgi:4-hydroxy-tetrahydrodipicolinate reductase
MTTTSIIVVGASGRMGARILALGATDSGVRIAGAVDRAGAPAVGKPAFSPQIAPNPPLIAEQTSAHADVVIDFSSAAGTLSALDLALARSAALLVGTTGLPPATVEKLRGASQKISVLLAPNTSLGVAAVADAAARLARALGPGYRASIVESHHIHKKDAPSGTALRLAGAVRDAGGELPDDQILSIRAGDIVGEHTIRFAGPGEVVDLTHRATSRDLFALGALRAAQWLRGRGPGWWTMEDVLGFARG